MSLTGGVIGGPPERVDGPCATPAQEGMAVVDVELGCPEVLVGGPRVAPVCPPERVCGTWVAPLDGTPLWAADCVGGIWVAPLDGMPGCRAECEGGPWVPPLADVYHPGCVQAS